MQLSPIQSRSFIDIVTQQTLPLTVNNQLHNRVVRLFVVAILWFSWPVFAQDAGLEELQPTPKAHFEISPNRCVTLRQGQPCFVRIRFNWHSEEPLQVCLRNMEGEKITCWQTSMEGTIVLPQTLPNTTEYSIVDAEGLEINRASVSVSWVYRKKRSKRRWRLF